MSDVPETNGKTKKKIIRASSGDIYKIFKLLEQHIKKNADGSVEYTGGHTDASIATLVRPDLTEYSVERIRAEHFGMMKPRLISHTDKRLVAVLQSMSDDINFMLEGLGLQGHIKNHLFPLQDK